MKQFLDKYKVLLTAIAAALSVTLQQFIGADKVDWKALGIAAILSVSGIIGNYLRGQYASMAGIIGVAGMTLNQLLSGGKITWDQVALSFAVAFFAMVAPPAKPRTYEHDPVIESAKNN